MHNKKKCVNDNRTYNENYLSFAFLSTAIDYSSEIYFEFNRYIILYMVYKIKKI